MCENNSLRNLITKDNQYIIKQLYFKSSSDITNGNGIGKRTTVNLGVGKYGDIDIDLISNPIIIFDLNDVDLEFVPEKIFNYITFEIGGQQIDKIYSNHMTILQKEYGLEVKKIGSKVFFPIPINCLLKSNGILASKCKFHEIRFWLEFTNEPSIQCIGDMSLRIDITMLANKPNWTNICGNILKESFNDPVHGEQLKSNEGKIYTGDFKNQQIIKIKHFQFTGAEQCDNNENVKIKTYFNHWVNKLYIFFSNTTNINGNIYKEQPFDRIRVIANQVIILDLDFETLLYETVSKSKSNSVLPKGVYIIEIDKYINYYCDTLNIELEGLSLPSPDIHFNVYAETTNYLKFDSNICQLMFLN